MGPGWTHSYNVFLTFPGSDVIVHAEDGQQVHFTNSGGTYVGDSGVRDMLVQNGDLTYTLTRRDKIAYQFNASGQLTSERNLNNQGLSFSYTGSQLTQVTDSVGRQIGLGYTNGLLTSLSLPDGRGVGYTYTGGILTGVTDIRSHPIAYGYDPSNRLNRITDQNNRVVAQVVYGTDGRVSQFTDGRLNTTYFSWDAPTQTATITDNRQKIWKFVYLNGVLLYATDPTGALSGWTHDLNLNTTIVTDAGNNGGQSDIAFKYDASGNLVEEDDPPPLNYVQTWAYNALNRITSFTDGRTPARTTRYEYDAQGNLTCELRANAPAGVTTCAQAAQDYKTTYAYLPGGTGLLQTKTSPNGNTWTYGYDSLGNLNSITGPPTPAAPAGSLTTMTYDPGGRLLTLVDPRGNVPGGNPLDYTWTYGHDNANDLTSAQDPLIHQTSYSYDSVGNRTSTTDGNNHVTRYEFDGNNNLTCVLYPTASVTTCAAAPQTQKANYAYDPNNNLLSRTDGNGHVWTFGYDDANRLHTTTSPLGRAWTYDYYPNGSLKLKTLPSGSITYTYDQLDRLTGISYSNGNTPNVTLGYDANDNRTSMTDGSGSVNYVYDDLNRLSSATRGGDAFAYQFWPGDQLKQVTYPDSTVVTYAYYADETLNTVSTNSATTTYGYDSAGHILTKSLPNGYVVTMAYDRPGRLTSVSNSRSGSTLSSFAYSSIDLAGNPTQMVTSSGTVNYTYDALDRLKTACYPACSGSQKNGFTYNYDPAGNVTSKVAYLPSSTTTTTYKFNNDDQLCWVLVGTSANGCTPTPPGGTTYSFEANGNETAAGSRTFTWDLENRVLTTTSGGTTHTYSYDGRGNRLQDSWGAGASMKVNYQWDVSQRLPQLALERDGNNSLIRRYVNGRDLLSMRSGASDYYYLPDLVGSVANLTSSAGAAEWTYNYNAFGDNRSTTKNDPSAPANLIRFDGQLIDTVDNLYDLRARMYDPGTTRFLQIDPIPAQKCEPYMSGYSYADDQPTALTDPSGLRPQPGRSGALIPLPSCAAITFFGTKGFTAIQVNPLTHRLHWGIFTYDPAQMRGDWFVIESIDGVPFNTKEQEYAPHGSVPPSIARPGAVFQLTGEATVPTPDGGLEKLYGDHACIVP